MAGNFIPRSEGVIQIDSSGGSLSDISDFVRSARINARGNGSNFAVLGEQWQKAVIGKSTWGVDLVIYMTDGASDAYKLLADWFTGAGRLDARTYQHDTPDSTNGSFRFTGEVMLDSLDPLTDVDASSNEPQQATARLLGDGALQISVIAS